jgi:hypothetical protein
MPNLKRWTEGDIAKLKSLAGKVPAKQIAAELSRTVGATEVVASKLGLSLRTQRAKKDQPSRADQARQVSEEYASDQMLRKPLN